jgi:TolA-binding protein
MNVSSLASGIEQKLHKLIERQKELVEKMVKYQKEIEELDKIQKIQQAEIHKLKEQYRILKLSKTLETKEGTVEAKAKINELVREIDKCIGLLNS